MSLHDDALFWVQRKTRGMLNHSGRMRRRNPYLVKQMEPDVVENANRVVNKHIYHEVEILPLSPKKLKVYANDKHRKVLWIVLPKGTSEAFDVVKVIEKNGWSYNEYKVKRC